MWTNEGDHSGFCGSKSSVSTTCTSTTTGRIDLNFVSPRTCLIMACSNVSMSIWCSIVYGLIFGGLPDSCKALIIHRYSYGLILECRIATINVVVCILGDVVYVWRGYEGLRCGECLCRAFVHNSESQLLSFTIGGVLVGSACAPSQLNYVGLSLSCDIDCWVTLDPKARCAWGRGWRSTISRVPDNKGRSSTIAEVTNV